LSQIGSGLSLAAIIRGCKQLSTNTILATSCGAEAVLEVKCLWSKLMESFVASLGRNKLFLLAGREFQSISGDISVSV
jgi:hypothetical protein